MNKPLDDVLAWITATNLEQIDRDGWNILIDRLPLESIPIDRIHRAVAVLLEGLAPEALAEAQTFCREELALIAEAEIETQAEAN